MERERQQANPIEATILAQYSWTEKKVDGIRNGRLVTELEGRQEEKRDSNISNKSNYICMIKIGQK